MMNTSSSSLNTRIASLSEVKTLLAWAEREGWNPGIDDAELFHGTDPDGFFITCVNQRPVAGVSVVRHCAKQAFLGLYLCLPEFRGTGIGLATWNAALSSLAEHTVGLDGVVEQQSNYRQSGFVYHFGNVRYSGVLAANIPAVTQQSGQWHSAIRLASLDDSQGLIEYDATIGGFQRRGFWKAWLSSCETRRTYVAVDEGAIVGIVGVRRCIDGFKIGPLLADRTAVALGLLSAVGDFAAGENVMLDVPDKNSAAIQMASSLALEPVFETARMYRGAAPAMDVDRLFGVATLELG